MIETIVAIFIMVTALSAGTGLAIYALSSSETAKNQTIAGNLAREGVEAVRIVRDSNWLAQTATFSPNCADIGKPCYPNAFQNITAFNPVTDNTRYRALFDPTTRTWSLGTAATAADFSLCQQSNGTFLHNNNGLGVACNNGKFARRVIIKVGSTASPYSAQNPDLIVESIVEWTGKRCPTTLPVIPNENSGQCKLILQDRLTNWKDYK